MENDPLIKVTEGGKERFLRLSALCKELNASGVRMAQIEHFKRILFTGKLVKSSAGNVYGIISQLEFSDPDRVGIDNSGSEYWWQRM